MMGRNKYKKAPSRTRWLLYGLVLGLVLGLAVGAAGIDAVLGLRFNAIIDGIMQSLGAGGG